jgi:hypothetical protein
MTSLRLLLPLAMALGAVSAAAEGPLQGNEVFDFHSSLSRADVHDQAVQAYRHDEIALGEIGQRIAAPMGTMRTRSEVRAEAVEAYRHDQIALGEIGQRVPSPMGTMHMRRELRAEAASK